MLYTTPILLISYFFGDLDRGRVVTIGCVRILIGLDCDCASFLKLHLVKYLDTESWSKVWEKETAV